jgi:hypothetical protein
VYKLAVVAAVLCGSPAEAAQIGEVLDSSSERFEVAAHGGWLAWSRYDGARDDFGLVVRTPAGVVRPMDVPRQRVPFDVSLGPGPGGGVAAVYSRCSPPRYRPGILREYVLPPGRRCSLRMVDLRDGDERRLQRASRAAAGPEFRPALWRNRVAYGTRLRDGRLVVEVVRVDGRGRRVVYRARNRYYRDLARVDLRRKLVAFSISEEADYEDCGHPDDFDRQEYGRTEIWIGRADHRPRVAESACRPREHLALFPSLLGGRVTYVQGNELVSRETRPPFRVVGRDTLGAGLFDLSLASSASIAVRRRLEDDRFVFDAVRVIP